MCRTITKTVALRRTLSLLLAQLKEISKITTCIGWGKTSLDKIINKNE